MNEPDSLLARYSWAQRASLTHTRVTPSIRDPSRIGRQDMLCRLPSLDVNAEASTHDVGLCLQIGHGSVSGRCKGLCSKNLQQRHHI